MIFKVSDQKEKTDLGKLRYRTESSPERNTLSTLQYRGEHTGEGHPGREDSEPR